MTDSIHLEHDFSRRYLAGVALVFLALALVIPLALLALSGRGLTNGSSDNQRALYSVGHEKQRIASAIDGPRIMLVGGSSSFYSVRAKTLQAELGIPVVNNALNAGLGVDYLLHRARQSLRRGDIVVLFLEYQHFEPGFDVSARWTLADYLLPYDLPYFVRQSPRRMLELAGALTPAEYWRRVVEGVSGQPLGEGVTENLIGNMNSYGDMVANRDADRRPSHAARLASFREPSIKAARVDADGSALPVARFVAWCRARDITVIAGFPPFLDFPDYHRGRRKAFFQSVLAYYRALGVPVLGTPFEFMYPHEMFFDTFYHLDHEGASHMTGAVLARLRPVLAQKLQRPPQLTALQAPRAGMLSTALSLDFTRPGRPRGVDMMVGFGGREKWGRWTVADEAKIEFAQALPHNFMLRAKVAQAYGENGRHPLRIRVGGEEISVAMPAPGKELVAVFTTRSPTYDISLFPARPVSPSQLGRGGDERALGIGLIGLTIQPRLPLRQPLEVDLSRGAPLAPDIMLTGFSGAEPWGRWTDGKTAQIRLTPLLPRRFRLEVEVKRVFEGNAREPLRVKVAQDERQVTVTEPAMVALDFTTDGHADTITLVMPKPASPLALGQSDDARLLGIGVSRLRILPLAAEASVAAEPARPAQSG